MQRELAALLHGAAIADALDRAREVRDDLIEAGNEYHLACAESIAGKPVAAAVDVDDFAAQGDRVDAAHQPVGRRRLRRTRMRSPRSSIAAIAGRSQS